VFNPKKRRDDESPLDVEVFITKHLVANQVVGSSSDSPYPVEA
jgi:hypothetical protein